MIFSSTHIVNTYLSHTSRKCPEIPGKRTKANFNSDLESVQLRSSNCKNSLIRVRLSVLEIVEKTFLHNNRRCCAFSHKIPTLTKTGLQYLGWPILVFFYFSLLPGHFPIQFNELIRKMQKKLEKVDILRLQLLILGL